jgi:hypothetical protein
MSERLANLLNLELAWERVKCDRPERTFVTNPYLIELVARLCARPERQLSGAEGQVAG